MPQMASNDPKTVKKHLLIGVLLLFNIEVFAQRTPVASFLQNNTLKTLRDLRDSLGRSKDLSADSLVDNLIKVINYTKTLKDADQLSGLNLYFSNAKKSYQVAGNDMQRHLVVKNLSRDLSYKLDDVERLSGLNLGPETILFHDCDVVVAVQLNGLKQVEGSYILYWAQFTGIDQATIIRKNTFNGSSKLFLNPYKLEIKLPGYITFWIYDTNKAFVYRSSQEYIKMGVNDKNLELNFVPFR